MKSSPCSRHFLFKQIQSSTLKKDLSAKNNVLFLFSYPLSSSLHPPELKRRTGDGGMKQKRRALTSPDHSVLAFQLVWTPDTESSLTDTQSLSVLSCVSPTPSALPSTCSTWDWHHYHNNTRIKSCIQQHHLAQDLSCENRPHSRPFITLLLPDTN